MKECTVCSVHKAEEDFYKHRTVCKECLSVRRKKEYSENPRIRENRQRRHRDQRRYKRLLVWDYLYANPCVDCGEPDPMKLEFDHRDRLDKSFEISEITRGMSVRRLWAEIEKCDVRCANCHRKKTWVDLGWEIPYKTYDWRDINVNLIKGIHGNTKSGEGGFATEPKNSR